MRLRFRMALILEEPEELNAYMDVASPRAWRMVWIKIQVLLPLCLFILVCGLEMIVFTAWLQDLKWMEVLWRRLLLIGIVVFPICGVTLTSLRFRKGTNPGFEIRFVLAWVLLNTTWRTCAGSQHWGQHRENSANIRFQFVPARRRQDGRSSRSDFEKAFTHC